jgi:hypothetical protein
MYAGNETAPDAPCVWCNKVLPNSSVLPAKLRTRQDTNHPEWKDQDIRFFKRMLEALTNFQSFMVKS